MESGETGGPRVMGGFSKEICSSENQTLPSTWDISHLHKTLPGTSAAKNSWPERVVNTDRAAAG